MFEADDRTIHVLRHGPVGRVSGDSVQVVQSAVNRINGATVSVQQSAVREASAERATLSQVGAVRVRADRLEMQESAALIAAGGEVTVEGSRVLFLLAPSVRGNVVATFTLPAAFALGFGYVMGRLAARALGRLLPFR